MNASPAKTSITSGSPAESSNDTRRPHSDNEGAVPHPPQGRARVAAVNGPCPEPNSRLGEAGYLFHQQRPEDPIERRVSAAQSQVILRFLFGAVVETWEFLRRPNNQKIIGSYLPTLDKDGTAARDELNKYFSSSNLLYNMRNKFSYHFPRTDDIDQGFETVPDNDGSLPWEWYLSETNSNSFYFSCEVAVGFGAISRVRGERDLMSAFRKLLREVIHTANTMQYFLMPLMRAILLKRFGASILQDKPGTTINDAPSLYDFWIPFFAESPVQD